MLACLVFDNRKAGYVGLALRADFPELNLPAWARLVASAPVADIHNLGALVPPVELTFFDQDGDHGLNFVSPLFSIPGFTVAC